MVQSIWISQETPHPPNFNWFQFHPHALFPGTALKVKQRYINKSKKNLLFCSHFIQFVVKTIVNSYILRSSFHIKPIDNLITWHRLAYTWGLYLNLKVGLILVDWGVGECCSCSTDPATVLHNHNFWTWNQAQPFQGSFHRKVKKPMFFTFFRENMMRRWHVGKQKF